MVDAVSNSQITAGVGTPSAATIAAAVSDKKTLAGNFQSFLQLLTTQLKNQNPLEPLDSNQFTQQLVQFAQVEQQLAANEHLKSIVTMEKAAQSTMAMSFVGTTVAIDGQTTALASGKAYWTFNSPKPAAATINIANAAGQTVYTGSYTMQAGQQAFQWDGKGNNGQQWPDGSYKISITAKDTGGNSVAVSTEVQGIVDSVDLKQNPPVLYVNNQSFTVDKINRVTRPRTS